LPHSSSSGLPAAPLPSVVLVYGLAEAFDDCTGARPTVQ
jgi:hypothetical protein